jgi:hypothetical protein
VCMFSCPIADMLIEQVVQHAALWLSPRA